MLKLLEGFGIVGAAGEYPPKILLFITLSVRIQKGRFLLLESTEAVSAASLVAHFNDLRSVNMAA